MRTDWDCTGLNWELKAAELRFYLSPFIPENLQSISDLLHSFPDAPCDRKCLSSAKVWTALVIWHVQERARSQSRKRRAPDPRSRDPPRLCLSPGTENDSSVVKSSSYRHAGTVGKWWQIRLTACTLSRLAISEGIPRDQTLT